MAEEKSSMLPAPVKSFLDRFTPTQRIFLVAVIVLTVAGIFLITNIANTFTYGTLYTNLSMKDSGLIIDQLKTRKIPYEIAGNGSVIRVPEEQVAELRITLAAEGLPEGGGVGFEIFDKASSFSTTDFEKNVNFTRAIEGELARSIMQLKEVSSAKVHITMPKRSVFIEDQEPAKASIVLKLKPGAMVGNNVVPAIVHLTAQAVEGLKPENIAVVDIYGTLLSKPDDENDPSGINEKQLAYQKTRERLIAKKIITLLEPIVGPGKVRANVRLKLNFTQEESTSHVVDPDKVAKISEKTEEQKSTGGTVNGGVPGVASNVGAAAGAGSTQVTTTPSSTKSNNTLTNFEVSKTVTHTKNPVGEIEQLSAAVVVDDKQIVRALGTNFMGLGSDVEKQSEKRTPEELQSLTRLVQASIGYDQARGDVVEVVNLPFDTAAATESDIQMREQRNQQRLMDGVKYLIYFIVGFIIFLKVVKPIYSKTVEIVKDLGKVKQEEIEIPKIDGERMAALREAKDDAEIERELLEQYKIPKSSKKMNIIKEKVIEFAEENVDGTASLVKSFLMED